jgi:hypothetical protein
VVNIFLEEKVATGHVDELIRKAVDQVLKFELILAGAGACRRRPLLS